MNITQVTGNEEIIHVFDQFEIIADDNGIYVADGDQKVKLPEQYSYWHCQVCRQDKDFFSNYPNEMAQLDIDW